MKIFPVFSVVAIVGCFFCFASTCRAGSVTVGHSNSGANYICDGVDDGYEINQALATKQDVKLITDSPYNIGSTSITVPGNDITYTLTANTPSNPPTIRAMQNCVMINATNAKFNISYLKFDGNGYQTSCIYLSQAWAGSRINNCSFGGYTSTSAWTATGIYGANQNSVLVDHNTFAGGGGVSVWIEGKTDPNNRGAYAQVSYNQFLFNSNGDYTKGNMGAIEGNHLHIDHNNIVSEAGEGMDVSRSWIEYNVVRGCAASGIKPTSWPIYDTVHGSGNYSTYYTDCANNAYDLIDHNIIEYNGANGIDYWYSDGSVVTNNRCNDNGQDADPNNLWDRDGIDVNDHSQNTTVSNNEATNKASTISDTVTAVGPNYVAVAHLNYWYDTRNGWIVPFNGLNVRIGSTNNRISSVDVGAAKIYLMKAPTGVLTGNTITGINEQTIGINVASNGQSLGHHSGAHNNVYGNLKANITPTINRTILPNTSITSDGTGPVPSLDNGTVCTNACSQNTCASGNAGYYLCSDTNGDGCLESATSATACQSGQTCSAGSCVAGAICSDECSSTGAKQCSGTGYQTCGNYDTDTCLEWSSAIACSTGQICSGGSCIVGAVCGNGICDSASETNANCPADCPNVLAVFPYRMSVNISNTGSALSNYQVKLTVPYNSHMQSDFDDVRFTAADGTTLLPYWLESYVAGSLAVLWVKVPSLASGNSTVFLYYGNSAASSASNGVQTFMFFDDFSGSAIDSAKWPTKSGKVTVGAGEAKIDFSSGYSYISSGAQNYKGIFEFRLKYALVSSTARLGSMFNAGFYATGSSRGIHLWYNGTAYTLSANNAGSYHEYMAKNTSSATQLYFDGVYKKSMPYSGNIGSFIFGNSGESGRKGTVWLDYAFTRTYAATEPAYTIGAESKVAASLNPNLLLADANAAFKTATAGVSQSVSQAWAGILANFNDLLTKFKEFSGKN